MFERFTFDARAAVVNAQAEARQLGARDIRAAHLLIALLGEEGAVSGEFASRGADVNSVRRAVQTRAEAAENAHLGGADAEALARLGIDLDEVRARLAAAFGPGALERRPHTSRGPWSRWSRRRRAGRFGETDRRRGKRRGGHLPFTSGAKKSLELSLREAVRLHDREIGARHLALGLLRAGDREVDAVLFTLGVDTAELRRSLEGRGRRAA